MKIYKTIAIVFAAVWIIFLFSYQFLPAWKESVKYFFLIPSLLVGLVDLIRRKEFSIYYLVILMICSLIIGWVLLYLWNDSFANLGCVKITSSLVIYHFFVVFVFLLFYDLLFISHTKDSYSSAYASSFGQDGQIGYKMGSQAGVDYPNSWHNADIPGGSFDV